jgi:hypothetical protein
LTPGKLCAKSAAPPLEPARAAVPPETDRMAGRNKDASFK